MTSSISSSSALSSAMLRATFGMGDAGEGLTCWAWTSVASSASWQALAALARASCAFARCFIASFPELALKEKIYDYELKTCKFR